MKKICFLFVLGILSGFIYAASVNDIEVMDGANRNKLADIIAAGGSGGGGGGGSTQADSAGTTSNNVFTGFNTFQGPTLNSGAVTNSSTVTFNGPTVYNAAVTNNSPLVLTNGFVFANTGMFADSTIANQWQTHYPVSGRVQLDYLGDMYDNAAGHAVSLRINTRTANDPLGNAVIDWSVNNTLTLGFNSSSVLISPASTFTTANVFNWNTGMWIVPATGVISNTAGGSGITTLNTLQGSNVVATSTDKWARWNVGTSTNAYGNGAGVPMQWNFGVVTMTNMPNGAQFNFGTIYTNITQQADFMLTAAQPTGLTAKNTAGIWFADGAMTGIVSMVTTQAGINGQILTNSCILPHMSPGALFSPTNVDSAAGAATVVPGRTYIKFY